ncbi:ORC complex protein Cdc6/Orc1 [Pyrodictium delaneyi]|uniref:ORC1-type DNA replication protein n=1 Tax=Pyrodictium delaneyi TaxID=1273541 RepID=A0A0P0N5I6_9CREN|nr:ORC1-type DNA replication protein [Pyrodictium delaneyi]ALL01686.1 ORC complex protein Cdc6/Orc1 [Pyrodictium delaneyi]OWJ55085.1 cell division control protein Cdc6 [Pyrodictium delaneyi]
MPTARDIIESVLEHPSVFKSREKLYPEYVPAYLPHREEQLKSLATYFRPLLLEPGTISQRVLLVGSIGTGKSATARRFGSDFKHLARQRGIKLEYVHVNCHRDRTLYFVVQEIARQLHIPIPPRGLSAQEMFQIILKHLENRNIYTIITLDEFDYFIEVAGNDAVYFLVRTYDEHPELTKRISYIFITRGLTSLSRLDSATESYLVRNVIHFKPYTSAELFDILKYRSSEAFYEGTISDDVLNYISELVGVDTGGSGNARLALEILMLAGTEADNEGSPTVTIEHVRRAFAKTNPNLSIMINDVIKHLPLHELLILLAAIRSLRHSSEAYVRIGEVEEEYQRICEEIGEKPRRHTQVYEYVMDLKKRGIIDARVSGKGYRGKSTLIGISIGPLELLEKHITEIIEYKRETE